jgi:hypothetical protein
MDWREELEATLINVERGQNVIITKAGNKGRKTKIASMEMEESHHYTLGCFGHHCESWAEYSPPIIYHNHHHFLWFLFPPFTPNSSHFYICSFFLFPLYLLLTRTIICKNQIKNSCFQCIVSCKVLFYIRKIYWRMLLKIIIFC